MKTIQIFVVVFYLAITTNICQGQITLNEKLRATLINLQKSANAAPFLFELSAHESDENWFVAKNYSDTNYLHNWWTVYYEMQHASYVLNFLPETFSLQYQAQEIYKTDTIPVGVFDLEFNRFKTDAFDSGKYFYWNDSAIWDNPARQDEPYEANSLNLNRGTLHDVFMGAPLLEFSHFKNVVFKIDPTFIFYSSPYNSEIQLPPTHKFKINFGDNSGWHEFDPTVITYYNANYDFEGTKIIEFKVVADNDLRYSKCAFHVLSSNLRKTPDETISISGLNAGIYYGCDNQPILDKVVIVASGYDFTGLKSIPQYYNQIVSTPQLIMLQNYGYDFVIIDFTDSRDSLQNQASSLISLIELLKCRLQNIENNFVLVGMSSGAMICNYALTKMETPGYISAAMQDTSICFPEQSHNTRLFISLDGEHQGAFLNIGAQSLLKFFASNNILKQASSFTLESMNRQMSKMYNEMLSRPGAKQFLMHHIDAPFGVNEFGPHPFRTAFLSELSGIGGSPKWCKTVATSNALLDGVNQVAFNNLIAQPGMKYFDLDLDLNIKILRVLPMRYELDLDLNANPLGSGRLMSFDLDYPNIINLFNGTVGSCLNKALNAVWAFWTLGANPAQPIFNTFFSCVGRSNISTQTDINNAEPWDIFPGGTIPVFDRVFDPTNNNTYGPSIKVPMSTINGTAAAPINLSLTWLVGLNIAVNTNGTGNVSAWAGASNVQVSLLSEMSDFNFTPWQSSLDYSNPDSLNQDLMNTPTSVNMSKTPFDVIVGHPAHIDYPQSFPPNNLNQGQRHFSHEHIRRDEVDSSLSLTWLTREIGETHMHLDNQIINRASKFEAKDEINAGINANPAYRSPTRTPAPSIELKALWSKDSGFDVVKKGIAQIKAGKEIRLQPGFSVTDSGELRAWIEPMAICTFTLEELRDNLNAPAPQFELYIKNGPDLYEYLSIYPNPTNGNLFIRSEVEAKYQVINLFGSRLTSGFIHIGVNNVNFDHFSNGIYIIHINQGERFYNFKVLKQ